MKSERSFRHEKIVYERPSDRYRCGRALLWRKPCWQGPDPAGACQGQSDCAPARIGDRWECRRPKVAGGKCSEGPKPDGRCPHTHPPCVPRPALRRWRGRAASLALLVVVLVFLVGVDPTVPWAVNPAALDAGELASSHAGFTREHGCGTCHASHRAEGLAWVASAFRANDPSGKCVDCHDFAGPPALVHNATFADRADVGTISCVRCHSEHKGAAVRLSQVPDHVCGNCHRRSFDNFAAAHPPFDERYPYRRPGRIYFDHARHAEKHFVDPKVRARSRTVAEFAAEAKAKCTVCHEVQGATREVAPRPYEKTCGTCHDRDVVNGELNVLEPGQLTVVASLLLGMEKDGDEEAHAKRLAELWQAVARDGGRALAASIAEAAGPKPAAEELFRGLATQLLRDLGSAWAAKRSLQAGAKEGSPGWGVRDNAEGRPALVYVPAAHGDPVLKAWIGFAVAAARGAEDPRRAIAADALEQLLDKDAVGACGKCHGAALRAASPLELERAWKRPPALAAPHSRFSHAPHLELLDPDAGCGKCHELKADSGYAKYFSAKPGKPQPYQSNFAGIRKEVCVECHQKGRVDSACQVCHAYHLPHRFKLGFRMKGGRS